MRAEFDLLLQNKSLEQRKQFEYFINRARTTLFSTRSQYGVNYVVNFFSWNDERK